VKQTAREGFGFDNYGEQPDVFYSDKLRDSKVT